jgi:hypothetical protein
MYEALQANPSRESLFLNCSSFDRQVTKDFSMTMHPPRRASPNNDAADRVAAISLGAGRGVELHIEIHPTNGMSPRCWEVKKWRVKK